MSAEFELQNREGVFYSLGQLRDLVESHEINWDSYVRQKGKVSYFPLELLQGQVMGVEEVEMQIPLPPSETSPPAKKVWDVSIKPLLVLAHFIGIVALVVAWDANRHCHSLDRSASALRVRVNTLESRLESIRGTVQTSGTSLTTTLGTQKQVVQSLSDRIDDLERNKDRVKKDLSDLEQKLSVRSQRQ